MYTLVIISLLTGVIELEYKGFKNVELCEGYLQRLNVNNNYDKVCIRDLRYGKTKKEKTSSKEKYNKTS